MSIDHRLLNRYSGTGAENYDKHRFTTARFQSENKAFEQVLGEVHPATVLDSPVGTGRWLERYRALGCAVTAVDISDDMLRQAREKSGEDCSPTIRFMKGNIFDATLFSTLGGPFDLVACVRFLNWIPQSETSQVLRNLNSVAGRHVLLGLSVLQGRKFSLRRLASRLHVGWINFKARVSGDARQHVHAEEAMADCFEKLGWRLLMRIHIFSGKGRDNFFLLFDACRAAPSNSDSESRSRNAA